MVPGSPFATGGIGLCCSPAGDASQITTVIVKNFLYVANGGSDNVSAFSINPATGVLTACSGFPIRHRWFGIPNRSFVGGHAQTTIS